MLSEAVDLPASLPMSIHNHAGCCMRIYEKRVFCNKDRQNVSLLSMMASFHYENHQSLMSLNLGWKERI
jgi:hypothetical protein